MSQRESAVPGWKKSSRCDNDLCVEVALRDQEIAIRDNARPETHLTFDGASWRALLHDVRAGRFAR